MLRQYSTIDDERFDWRFYFYLFIYFQIHYSLVTDVSTMCALRCSQHYYVNHKL